ncbi:MAG: hypothetical protein IJ725_02665, partial [Ruminococcus sp.]|nr:hypothetical protein [Ruminococcus sp.]
MQYKLRFESVVIEKRNMTLKIAGEFSDPSITSTSLATPKVIFHFMNDKEDRRIPMVIMPENIVKIDGKVIFNSEYTYSLDCIFWKTRKDNLPFNMYVNLSYADFYEEAVKIDYTPKVLTQDKCFYTMEVKEDCFAFTTNSSEIRSDHKKENMVLLFDRALKALAVLLSIPLIPIYVIMGLLSFTGYIKMPAKIETENKVARLFSFVMTRISAVCRENFSMVRLKRRKIKNAYKRKRRLPVKENRITFYSA